MTVVGRSDPFIAPSMLVRASTFSRDRSVACIAVSVAGAAPVK
jgi:hypothetical protein